METAADRIVDVDVEAEAAVAMAIGVEGMIAAAVITKSIRSTIRRGHGTESNSNSLRAKCTR